MGWTLQHYSDIPENRARPFVDFYHGKIMHNDKPCIVKLTRNKIRVGCTEVTPRALRELIRLYDLHFGEEGVTIQDGK